MMRTLTSAFCLLLVTSTPLLAQARNCGDFTLLHNSITERYDEKPILVLHNNEHVQDFVIIYANAAGWTVLTVRGEHNVACIVAAGLGEHWWTPNLLPIPGEDG